MTSKTKVNRNNQREEGMLSNLELELSLKSEKARAKSNFSQSWNKIQFLIETSILPSRIEIVDAVDKLDIVMEIVMISLESLSKLYLKIKDSENRKKIIAEMEKVDEEYSTAYKEVRKYIGMQSIRPSETIKIQTINLSARNNISE